MELMFPSPEQGVLFHGVKMKIRRGARDLRALALKMLGLYRLEYWGIHLRRMVMNWTCMLREVYSSTPYLGGSTRSAHTTEKASASQTSPEFSFSWV